MAQGRASYSKSHVSGAQNQKFHGPIQCPSNEGKEGSIFGVGRTDSCTSHVTLILNHIQAIELGVTSKILHCWIVYIQALTEALPSGQCKEVLRVTLINNLWLVISNFIFRIHCIHLSNFFIQYEPTMYSHMLTWTLFFLRNLSMYLCHLLLAENIYPAMFLKCKLCSGPLEAHQNLLVLSDVIYFLY